MPCYCYRRLQQSTCFGPTLLQSSHCHKLFRDVDAFWCRSPIVLWYCRLARNLFDSSPVPVCRAATILNRITFAMRHHSMHLNTTLAIHSVAYCGSPRSVHHCYSARGVHLIQSILYPSTPATLLARSHSSRLTVLVGCWYWSLFRHCCN
jgi:hypothetical protein